jgi:hypothetical protein
MHINRFTVHIFRLFSVKMQIAVASLYIYIYIYIYMINKRACNSASIYSQVPKKNDQLH